MEGHVLAPLSFEAFEGLIASDPRALDVHLDLVESNIEIEGCDVRIHCHCLKVDANGRVNPKRLADPPRLSRMSAVALYELIAKDDLDQQACRKWVRENNDALAGTSMPVIIVRELREKLLGDSEPSDPDPIEASVS